MAIDKNTLEYVAHLARIELQPKELEKLSGQLKEIIGFIDRLSELDTAKIDPTSHILPISNVLREDRKKSSFPAAKALQNAPALCGDFFSVPKVIE